MINLFVLTINKNSFSGRISGEQDRLSGVDPAQYFILSNEHARPTRQSGIGKH